MAKGKKILVTGPNANSMRCLNGGWSYTWQGNIAERFAGEYKTISEPGSKKFGGDLVTLAQGGKYVDEGA